MSIFRGLLFALALAFVPALAMAAEFQTGETRASIARDRVVADDLYIASGDVDVDGTVEGDVIAVGGNISIRGRVAGDLIVAGGLITVSGAIGDDVRAAGGTITISGRVGDDVLIGGGTVEITSEAEVVGEVRAGTGVLTIAGKTGKVEAGVGDMTVASTATINGDLTYWSDTEETIEAGATITGTTLRKVPPRYGWQRVTAVGGVFPFFTLLMALLFFYLLPNKSAAVAEDWRARFWSNLLWGFLFMIAVPIAIVILFVSIVGFPVAFGTMAVYPIMLYLGNLVAAIGLGTVVKNLWEKERNPRPTWLAVVLGVAGFAILSLIPFLGWIALFLFFLAGLGALIRYDWDVLKKLRANKTL